MTSASAYDGIIIGAGQHGLILGSYLAKAGLRVLLVERRLGYGGGLSTEERTLPGFYHNLHSINHFSISSTPWFKDLDLAAKMRYIVPRYEFAQPHADGSALVFSRDLDETAANIARFSASDAKTFREWNIKAEEMTKKIFLKERFAPPLSEADRAEVLGRSALGSEFLELTKKQPLDAVNELFENEYVKVLFLFKLSLFGTVLHEALNTGSPVGSLIRAFDLATGYELAQGGSWNLARSLMETFIASGGEFRNQTQVERIVVEGNRATGVELADGTVIKARQFVASTIDVYQTFEKMVGREQLPAETREKVANHKYTPWTLFGLHLALADAPRYRAGAFDPHVDTALKYNIGSETIASLLEAHDQVEQKKVPSNAQFGAGALSVLDPLQAPPGKHTAYAWQVVPYDIDSDPDAIDGVRDQLQESILEKWREYAPNMTPDNVLGSYTYTAKEYTQEITNMRYGDIFMGALTSDQVMYNHFGYRTAIDGLYMAGSPCHPNGAITGGAGYIGAGVIASDLGITPWWTPMDARSELEGLE
ncbi:NAD(P)/FAD-dependent oxidoreductase [Acrocarpospora macrocephala]|uniref:Pyridine nucleotide-disulfide oxidoreductase domain-containing protein 2 n=1 Tax=Acrocarpospora macrocephala TaxID=150177 RepID=A0A5M3WKQ2_9ACTN|nr:NAD(P)/FAD-dependent oxidoreductase [Acrocarpospora macrocephala]GES09020.1 FAD-dependent oxidoreductase [Acrocarpospora macrocephala]